jgi:putative CRISPR-associated protein (TIGR02619 family)
MKVVINIVGSSLLTNKLYHYILNGKSLPPELTNCLDQKEWIKLSAEARCNLGNIMSNIRQDAEESLMSFLPANRLDPISASAETHSIKLLIDKLMSDENSSLKQLLGELKLYFIASNTTAGRACAQALFDYYKNTLKVKEVVSIKVIEHLTGDAKVFQQGITEMIDKLIELITNEKSKGNEVFINATGGFKPEGTYATLCGLLNEVNVCYAHEYFESEIVLLPSVPLGFDFNPWHLSASKIQLALSGSRPAYESLPHQIRELMVWDEEGKVCRFNQLGYIFWTTYQDNCARHRLSPQKGLLTDRIKSPYLRDKILKFIDGWDNIWVGMQLPQMVDHTQAHCQNMLILAEQLLLPMGDFLTEEELYVLIACIWLHDIGHSEPIEIKDDGTEEALSPQEIRNKHHLLTYQLIKAWPKEFGFPSFNDEAKVIAEICRDHRTSRSVLESTPEKCEFKIYDSSGKGVLRNVEIRRRLITALLQLIDTCDTGAPRAGTEDYIRARLRVTERELENLRKRKAIAERDGERHFAKFLEDNISFREPSRWHFEKHRQVAKVEVKPEKLDHGWKVRIVIHPAKADVDIISLVSGKPINMTEDIEGIKGFLRPHISDVAIEPGPPILSEE